MLTASNISAVGCGAATPSRCDLGRGVPQPGGCTDPIAECFRCEPPQPARRRQAATRTRCFIASRDSRDRSKQRPEVFRGGLQVRFAAELQVDGERAPGVGRFRSHKDGMLFRFGFLPVDLGELLSRPQRREQNTGQGLTTWLILEAYGKRQWLAPVGLRNWE
jgi:hypothetical protein